MIDSCITRIYFDCDKFASSQQRAKTSRKNNTLDLIFTNDGGIVCDIIISHTFFGSNIIEKMDMA